MTLLAVVAAAVAALAALLDVHQRRIPNWLTVSTFVVGIGLNAWQSGVTGALLALAGGLLGLAILLPFYAVRGLGAGDVKLLAALGAVVGPQVVIGIALYGAVLGGVMSIVVLARRRRLGFAVREMVVLRQTPSRSGAKAPYGLAIAGGVYLAQLLPLAIG
jgi:prepilin peptidase CpaA